MKNLYFTLTAALSLFSCAGDGSVESSPIAEATVSAEDRLMEIDNLTTDFFAKELKESTQDEADSLANALEVKLVSFVTAFPKHDKSPDHLERAAQLSRRKKDYKQGMLYYDQIIKDYPDYKNTVDILFTKAFVYDNELRDKEAAREAYELVANTYPDTKFGQDAKTCLSILHMSDEELIEAFEKANGIESE